MYSSDASINLKYACSMLRIGLKFHPRCRRAVKRHKRDKLCTSCGKYADDIVILVDKLGSRLESTNRFDWDG